MRGDDLMKPDYPRYFINSLKILFATSKNVVFSLATSRLVGKIDSNKSNVTGLIQITQVSPHCPPTPLIFTGQVSTPLTHQRGWSNLRLCPCCKAGVRARDRVSRYRPLWNLFRKFFSRGLYFPINYFHPVKTHLHEKYPLDFSDKVLFSRWHLTRVTSPRIGPPCRHFLYLLLEKWGKYKFSGIFQMFSCVTITLHSTYRLLPCARPVSGRWLELLCSVSWIDWCPGHSLHLSKVSKGRRFQDIPSVGLRIREAQQFLTPLLFMLPTVWWLWMPGS